MIDQLLFLYTTLDGVVKSHEALRPAQDRPFDILRRALFRVNGVSYWYSLRMVRQASEHGELSRTTCSEACRTM